MSADFWPGCGYATLQPDAQGGLPPSDGYIRHFLARPELAPVPESCDSERALHAALLAQPRLPVTAERLARLKDADAQDNYRVFLHFRDSLLAAGTLQACYLAQFRPGPVTLAPPFIDALAQTLLRHLLRDSDNAFEARAAEMLFRPQRISISEGANGRVLAADRQSLDHRHATAGLGSLGQLLLQANAPLRGLDAPVLAADQQALYWQRASEPASAETYPFLLDLTHEITRDLGHGIQFKLGNAHSGLPALARVLERWVQHLLGVAVRVQPVQRIADERWRWHVGLDAEATALLNDLYEEQPVDDSRMQRLLSLFKLEFVNPAEMRPDVAGKPVYLGMAMTADGQLRLKPQNLLINLPLRAPT